MARGLELDLVEVAPMANPPVCRIMDYGKFRYEEAQKAKESRRKSTNVSVKEVKFRPKIGRGDFDVKVRKVDQFIHEGHKVKVTLQFRGREMAHPELGTKILDQVLGDRRRVRQGRDPGPPRRPQHVDGALAGQEGAGRPQGGRPGATAGVRRRGVARTTAADDDAVAATEVTEVTESPSRPPPDTPRATSPTAPGGAHPPCRR